VSAPRFFDYTEPAGEQSANRAAHIAAHLKAGGKVHDHRGNVYVAADPASIEVANILIAEEDA